MCFMLEMTALSRSRAMRYSSELGGLTTSRLWTEQLCERSQDVERDLDDKGFSEAIVVSSEQTVVAIQNPLVVFYPCHQKGLVASAQRHPRDMIRPDAIATPEPQEL